MRSRIPIAVGSVTATTQSPGVVGAFRRAGDVLQPAEEVRVGHHDGGRPIDVRRGPVDDAVVPVSDHLDIKP